MEGQFTQEQLEKIKEMFNYFDKDGDGVIKTQELGDLIRALGGNPTNKEIEDYTKQIDPENTGKIEYKEFEELYSKIIKDPITLDDLIEALKIFDKEGTGFISAEEIKQSMLNLGDKLSADEVKEMFKGVDINSKGYVSYVQFAKKMIGQ